MSNIYRPIGCKALIYTDAPAAPFTVETVRGVEFVALYTGRNIYYIIFICKNSIINFFINNCN